MILFLQIVGGLAALGLGIYLGSGSYTQTQDEIEASLSAGAGKPKRAKRHFMWLDYFKAQERGSVRRRGQRQPFKNTIMPDRSDRPRKKTDRA
jgi:hypothetical protein